MIDESSPSDADYTESPLAPANATLDVGLSDVEDPQSSSGHTVRYRYAKNAAGGAQIDLTVSLRQGVGTQIAAWAHTNISETVVQQNQSLSAGEADAITDYADIRLRFVANQV